MSLWHRLKVRLGLEDDYEDYDDEYYEDDEYDDRGPQVPSRNPYSLETSSSVKRVDREAEFERSRNSSHLRSVPDPREYSRDSSRDYGRDAGPSAPAQVKMHIVEPRSFGEAQGIGDRFKQGTPVIMNLTGSNADLSKRLLDFATGLTYGLDGGLQKVSDRVFMLTPANVDVSAEDRRRLKDKGLFSID